ncbi:MAG: SPOR domain-containing protein [Aquificae bacterium]|nr:SPOR domain-containing protein [Aquificota bacterium]
MAKKQRLIFLLTLLVGLALFYFGIDTWMEQKSKQTQPQVVLKPSPPLKPPTPQEQTKEQKQEPRKEEKPKEEKPKQEPQKPQKEEKQETRSVQKEKKTQTVQKRELKSVSKKVPKTPLRTYKFQVGAFKYKENAYKLLRKARKLGYTAKVVKSGNLYKVYVYVKARNLSEAKRLVKRHFADVILVRR